MGVGCAWCFGHHLCGTPAAVTVDRRALSSIEIFTGSFHRLEVLTSAAAACPQAHRIQHNNARGPYKGGLLYHPCVSFEEMSRQDGKKLSFLANFCSPWVRQAQFVVVELLY